jgi:LuxR family transcriptional regulator, maltose regulon positive regulatory protein
VVRLVLSRWRGDIESVLTAMPLVEEALASQQASARALSDELRSVALQNLGVAEQWSSRLQDARRDLEQALDVARRAHRPWLEIPPLGHLGIAGPWTGLSLSARLGFSKEAVRIAESHGWGEDPAIVTHRGNGLTVGRTAR